MSEQHIDSGSSRIQGSKGKSYDREASVDETCFTGVLVPLNQVVHVEAPVDAAEIAEGLDYFGGQA